MRLLCVDTSGLKGTLAVAELNDWQLSSCHQVEWLKKAMHSEVATVQLTGLLRTQGLELGDLTHIVVNIGPGSFTGLRVGLSLAKTLAYSLNLPVNGLSSLEVLAYKKSSVGQSVLIATKAVQSFHYLATFKRTAQGLETLLAPMSVDGSELDQRQKNCNVVGIEGLTPGFTSQTEAQDLADLVVKCENRRMFSNWKVIEPLYVRASEAEEKLRRRTLGPN